MSASIEARPQAQPDGRVPASRLAAGVILSILSGVMLLLAFPPYGLWPLAWIALVPAMVAQHRLLPRKWSRLAAGLYALFWLGPYLARLFGTEFGPFFTFLGALIAVLSYFAATERNFHELTGYRWFVLYGVINWVGFEMIRATFIPLIATSAFIGYTQATQTWLIQPVSVFSVFGLNLVIMLFNYALAQSVMAWIDRKWKLPEAVPVERRATWRWMAGAGAVLLAWSGLSVFLLNTDAQQAPTVRVAALRSNYPMPAFQDEVNGPKARFDTIAQQARQAAAEGAQILFTSEMIIDFDPQQEFTEEFRALARETGAYLFITYAVAREGEPFRNQAVLLSPAGEFSEVYSKTHIPPGEPPSPVTGVFPVFETPLGRLASLICHDANYTDVARELTRNGAQLIAAPFREFRGFGEQLWTNVTFRAVENRVAMVVTGSATVAAIIDSHGRQLELDVNRDGGQLTLIGDLPLGSGKTPYLTLGDWLGWVSLAGYVFFVIFQVRVGQRAKKAASGQPVTA